MRAKDIPQFSNGRVRERDPRDPETSEFSQNLLAPGDQWSPAHALAPDGLEPLPPEFEFGLVERTSDHLLLDSAYLRAAIDARHREVVLSNVVLQDGIISESLGHCLRVSKIRVDQDSVHIEDANPEVAPRFLI